MQILVRTLNNEQSVLDVEQNDTILSVKELIQESKDILVDQQRLIFAGKNLEDDRTLYDYNIQNQSTIQLILCFPVKRTPEKDDLIEVCVRHFTSRNTILQVSLNDTVQHVKEQIYELEGIPLSNQRLLFNGNQLHDAELLNEYGIQDKTIIDLY